MAMCLNRTVHQSNYDGNGFGIATKSISTISKGWQRLQIRCNQLGLLMTGSLEKRASSFVKYVMLEDDGYEEGFSPHNPTCSDFGVEVNHDLPFIPQWSRTMIEPQCENARDLCIIGNGDDGTDMSVVDTLKHISSFVKLIDSFPGTLTGESALLEILSMNMDEVEEICGISFLRPGENNKRKKYRIGEIKITATRHVSDSETEEDSSSMSSDPEIFCLDDNNSTSTIKAERNKNIKERRSIRFSDEVFGQSLATIHFVPWSEHDDPEWIPRQVRCRIEL